MVAAMDPNAALQEIRRSIEAARDAAKAGNSSGELACLERAAERFEGLDRWIKTGGFLPADWEQAEAQR